MKNRVREERKRRAMTQAELSELSGVSRATISALENGASRITTTKTLLRIARALNVPIRELLCEPNEGDETLKIEEEELALLLGEDRLKSIGEQVAEIVRQHGLHKSPDVCRKLFLYLSNVIDGWNCV